MGGKGGGSQTSTTTSSLPPEVVQAYQDVTNQAKNVSSAPLQQYQGNIVAPFSDMQNQAFSGLNAAQGAYQPYFNQAQGLIGQGTQQYTPTAFSQSAIDQYESPYTQDVINSTLANINQENGKQQSSLQGNAIARGAWGGDRADLARNDLARQQALASNQTIAGLENQNYSQALVQFNQTNQTGMNAAQLNSGTALQGAGLQGAMGNYAQANQLNSANAQLAGGSLQQQLAQAQLMVPYQQFQQQQAYPFQTTQYLANIVEGLGNQGGTSTTTQPASQNGGIFGFLGLKSGGKVSGYASGGIVPEGFYPGGPVGDVNPFGIPDVSQSYVPMTQSMPSQSSIPEAPKVDHPQQKQTTLNDLISTGKNLSGIGQSISPYAKGLGQFGSSLMGGSGLGESAAYGMNTAGFGNAAYDMLAAGDAAAAGTAATAAAGGSADLLTTLMAFFNKGGKVSGYSNGGSIPDKYARGGWQQQPLFDSPMYSPQAALDAETAGLLPSNGQVGGLSLSPTMNNNLADLLSDPAIGTPMSPSFSPQVAASASPVVQANDGPLHNSGQSSDIIAKLAQLNGSNPDTMGALMSGVKTAQVNPMSNGIMTAQNSIPAPPTTDTPLPPQDNQPPALTNLQMELAKNAPVLDKDAALWTGVAGALASRSPHTWQAVGEGLQAGLGAYGQQKAAVAEYALKKAEADEKAEQLAAEAARYNKSLSIQQQNADTNEQYRKDMAGTAKQNADTKAKAAVQINASDMFKNPEDANNMELKGQKLLDSLNPQAAAKVNGLLEGSINPADFSTKNGQRDKMIGLAKIADPNYSDTTYPMRKAAMASFFGNGVNARVINSYNMVTDHAAKTADLMKELKQQGIWTPGNTLANILSSNTGNPLVKKLQQNLTALSTESAKLMNPSGVATDSQISENRKGIELKDSMDQGLAEVQNLAGLVSDRMKSTQEEYIRQLDGKDIYKKNADAFIHPDSRVALKKLGIPIKNFYGDDDSTAFVSKYTDGQIAHGPKGDIVYREGKGWMPVMP